MIALTISSFFSVAPSVAGPVADPSAIVAAKKERSQWLTLVLGHKFDEAAAMMSGETAGYKVDDKEGQPRLMPKRAFVEWVAHCRALEIPLPDRGDEVTTAYHVLCQKRSEDGTFAQEYTEKFVFFLSATPSSVRTW